LIVGMNFSGRDKWQSPDLDCKIINRMTIRHNEFWNLLSQDEEKLYITNLIERVNEFMRFLGNAECSQRIVPKKMFILIVYV